ncbi:aldehyde dehydrogenase family protein [Bacterioplanoides sp.]|uniref:aldehyde dehydrogenase family protein n=1 Tax=Bacterioplanoides sp. TaxID=2066072 RepID=UPI003B00CD99
MNHYLESVNPLNGDIVGRVATTSEQQLQQVVSNARQAQTEWAQQSLQQRVEILTQAYQQLEPQHPELTRLISLEMGKDQRRAHYEAGGAIANAPYMAREAAEAFEPKQIAVSSQIQYQPLGVVGLISPWNYPLAMANNLLIPALIAGNSVVLKPSENTPLVADLFVKTLQQYLPENLLQIVHGAGDVGRALVQADINMIAFTGSVAAGRDIMANAASGLKRLVMELGGNDPMIVMAGADINAAARFAVASSFENAGQMCTSTERIYVDHRVADEFRQRVVQLATQYRAGGWNELGVNIGPLVNATQHQKVLQQLQDAKDKGAEFLLGDAHYPLPFIQPTVVDGLTADMQLEQLETFGPVVAMASVNSMEEAIRRANDSDYGLGAVVFGGAGAADVANQLQAGMVSVNGGVGGPGDSPWVGAKHSGFGYHGSAEGHRQFTQIRVMNY